MDLDLKARQMQYLNHNDPCVPEILSHPSKDLLQYLCGKSVAL